MHGRLSITDVAKAIGVTPRTIMRWEKSGKIKRSKRDWRGWRFYVQDDLESIRKFYESSYEYNESERTIMDLTKATTTVAMLVIAFWASSIICAPACAQGQAQGVSGVRESKTAVDINLAALPARNNVEMSSTEAMKYTFGPDDIIEIEVRRHPEFSGQYTVNSEGKIEYKFVGDVIVRGLNKKELQDRLSQILSEYIVDPDVNVRIAAYLSKVFYVVGEVGRPGKFFMRGDTIKVREALVEAGLPTTAAAMRRCRLITPSEKTKNDYVYVNVYELLYGGDLKCNIDMKPGDVLYVPSTVMAKIIRVISPVTDAASQTAGAAARGAAMAAVAI